MRVCAHPSVSVRVCVHHMHVHMYILVCTYILAPPGGAAAMDSWVGCGHLGSPEFILWEKELNIREENQKPKGTTVVGARKVK